MAQFVGYMENGVTYTQGPFVVVGFDKKTPFRVEVACKHTDCPVLPAVSIYTLAVEHEKPMSHSSQLADTADWLNALVDAEVIVLDNGWWVTAESVKEKAHAG